LFAIFSLVAPLASKEEVVEEFKNLEKASGLYIPYLYVNKII